MCSGPLGGICFFRLWQTRTLGSSFLGTSDKYLSNEAGLDGRWHVSIDSQDPPILSTMWQSESGRMCGKRWRKYRRRRAEGPRATIGKSGPLQQESTEWLYLGHLVRVFIRLHHWSNHPRFPKFPHLLHFVCDFLNRLPLHCPLRYTRSLCRSRKS